MTWNDEHRKSEAFASRAQVAAHEGAWRRARQLY